MEELINHLLRFGHINQQQIELVKSKAAEIRLPKGDYFSEAGKIAKQVGFLTSGILRVCYYNNKSDEFTRCFVPENRFAVDYYSFTNELPCAEYVEALTDCKMLIFSKSAFTELTANITEWNAIISKIMSAALMQKMRDAQQLLVADGTARYLHFLEQYPGLANRVPLSAVASYLGVTQSSLSRIRKNLQS